MKRDRFVRAVLGFVVGAASAMAPGVARAQSSGGWALDRFQPTPYGDNFFLAEHPWYSSQRVFSVGAVVDFASNPLVLRRTFDDGRMDSVNVVSSMLVAHVGGAVSFADRVGLALSFPLSLSQAGERSTAGGVDFGPAGSLAPGDLQVGLRVRLFGQADSDAFSLHLGAQTFIPVGSRENNTGDGGLRLEPRLIAAGRGGPVRWAVNVGFQVRTQDIAASNLAVGNEFRASAALGFVADDGRFTIGPEAYLHSSVRELASGESAFFQDGQFGAEVLGSVHYLIADTILLGAGAGPGIARGYGVPSFRGLFSVAYAPITRPPPVGPVDTDRDGVMDPDDQCVTVPMGPHPDPQRRGCPALDTDGDGVYDFEDQCVNDPMGANPDPERRGCPLVDRDGDGVFDREDQCPDTHQGPNPDPTRRGCPAGDRDNDTVLDHDDVCPDTPQGPFPDPARRGCPLPDRDGDTVPDPTDHCPDQPGAPSSDPNLNGCPSTVSMQAGRIVLLEPIYFATDRADIQRRSDRLLDRVADVLRSSPHIRRVSCDGHTDNRGDPEYNLGLSQRRMQSVMDWLVAHGIDASRLEAHGYGMTRPIADNTTREGRARNRRVEFVILDPAQPGAAPGQTTVLTTTTPTVAPNTSDQSGRRRRRRH
ncbi:MAG: OmpA family protein [Deltaproteobacteria bacterium]|nr:OmpA family protein [Deltaproteobacteria bacterium]